MFISQILLDKKDLEKFNSPYPHIDYKHPSNDFARDDINFFNMVVVGHVDSGKSTLIGHLCLLMNIINKKQMHNFEKVENVLDKIPLSFTIFYSRLYFF